MASSHPLSDPLGFLQLLANAIRWQILQRLAGTDMHVQELVEVVQQPQNLVSYHLGKLRDQGLLREQRSIADGREIYYSLDLGRMRSLYSAVGESLHPALSNESVPADAGINPEMKNPVRVLFLCTHNSARSQMAEGILRSRSDGQIEVFSAGTEATRVHPLAIRAMQDLHIDISSQYSKSLTQFIDQDFDYIITVCDRAKESCPLFPGDPVRIHWSIPDPADATGSDQERYQAFKQASIELSTRISYLLIMIKRQHGLSLD